MTQMSDNARNYMDVVREYSKEIIMFLGFAMAFLVYSDFKTFMSQQIDVLQKIESRLTAIETEAQIMLDRTDTMKEKKN